MPVNKTIETLCMIIVVRVVFYEHNKYYPQVFLDKCLDNDRWKRNKNIIWETKSFYISLSFILITIALLIAVSIYCYLIKYKAKKKKKVAILHFTKLPLPFYLLPFYVINKELKKVLY